MNYQTSGNGYKKRSLWHWIIIYFIVAAVVYGLAYYFFLAPKNSYIAPSPSVTQTPENNQNVVIYTDSGFSPSALKVKSGDTVIFKNAASDAVWVASNPHPSHTDYPGFDAKRPYKNSENYSFIFTKPGNWGYHNHLNPGEGGIIIVQ